ncbi:uncharacterized protein [Henckelia pumila]|uniref:uncharacterized protein isoform X1 n=1 Tax=Henckelia pumila TaxID=405737 RepID=UPI003C6E90B4
MEEMVLLQAKKGIVSFLNEAMERLGMNMRVSALGLIAPPSSDSVPSGNIVIDLYWVSAASAFLSKRICRLIGKEAVSLHWKEL